MKKTLPLVLLPCLLASPAWAAITELSTQRASVPSACDAVDSCALDYPDDVTAGNLLIVGGGAWDNPEITSVVVTDTVGTSYTTILCDKLDTEFQAYYVAYGIAAATGANTVTVNPSGSSANRIRFSIDEFTGQAASPLDVDGGSSTSTGTAVTDSITTGTANALIIGLAGMVDSTTITQGGDYTQIGEYQGDLAGNNLAFRIVTTATSYTVDWTLAASMAWQACTVSFKEAVAASPLSSQVPFMVILGD